MTRKWYKVLVVALVLVARVRLEDGGWPLSEAEGAEGDNSRTTVEDPVARELDYSDEHLMEPESRKDLVSKAGLYQDNGESDSADEVRNNANDDDEVEDLAYDSDIEKINSKTVLKDVDTGKQTGHDTVRSETHGGRRSELRQKQHWDDKTDCLIDRRDRVKFTQKELSRGTRELVTREPPIYYDMKRAKRRMLAFPRHGSEDRSSWGAKILEALETALNSAAKQNYNMDQRESITGQYSDKTILTDMGTTPTHSSSTSQDEEPKRNTFLTDHRLPLTNVEQEERTISTPDSPRSERTRTSAQQKQTFRYYDIAPTVTNIDQNHDKKVLDPHRKREKSYNTWSRYRDNSDDSPREEEGRMDVMPYADETVKPERGRGESYALDSNKHLVIAQKKLSRSKAAKGNLLRTSTSVALQRTKVFTTTQNVDSLMVDSDSTSPSAEALDSSMGEQSQEKTTIRIKNFYPIKHNPRHFNSESKKNEDDEKSLAESSEMPSSATPPPPEPLPTATLLHRTNEMSSETNQESSDEYTSEESKANSLVVSQKHQHNMNRKKHHSSNPNLIFDTSKIDNKNSGIRHNKEFHTRIGTEENKITPGQGLIADPDFPAQVVASGIEELFILPEASYPMRRHWESFYKSVSKAARQTVSHLVIVLFFQYLIVT